MIEKPLSAEAPLVEAVRAIELTHRRIAVITDADGRLLGTLTDGDIRRCLLAGGTLQTAVEAAMNTSPMTAPATSPDGYLMDLLRRRNVLAIPLLDEEGRYLRTAHISDLSSSLAAASTDNFSFAVIMAGGRGMRLRPITETIPKPMVDVGGVPLLERLVSRLAQAGIGRVYLSVNYLSHVIEKHFGDGSEFGLEICYLKELDRLGTGGALALLPERPSASIVVMNGDILTTSDLRSLHSFHIDQGAAITIAAIDYSIEIPFGVISNEGSRVTRIVEKPSQRFRCNAGIYALSPTALDMMPTGAFNMTDLVERCLDAGKPVAVFPIHEYWSDVGTVEDLDKARRYFSEET